MTGRIFAGVALAAMLLTAGPAAAEQLLWGVKAEQLEYRRGGDSNLLAWDVNAHVGTDELKLVYRSEGEFKRKGSVLERFENHFRAQVPISTFFDAVGGVRIDTPEGPDRVHGLIGLHGLAPQWFEVDADFFVSDHPSFRLEVEYEALITNRLILTPSLEFDLPFKDDTAIDIGAWGPKAEIGLRLGYDLIDRLVSPYVGVHYERVFGKTRDLARAEGKDDDAFYLTVGMKMIF
jgi:copper resistance protein B